MMNRIENLRKERKSIINEYSKKLPNRTYIDSVCENENNVQYVYVKDIKEESSDTKSFILAPDKKRTSTLAPFMAGQYISLKIHQDDVYYSRAYSLSSSPALANKNLYRITIKRVEDGIVSNYMLDNIKVGSTLTISNPVGEFGYNRIRDEKNVIGISGGSGITPFISMAYSIIDGLEDYNLTVFYSVKTYDDILFKKEIMDINKRSNKVKFVITLTREEKEGYLHGHINKEMMEPYVKEFNTIFMCGPKGLYKAMNDILIEFNILKKSVHYENYFMEYKPAEKEMFNLKVILKNDFVLTKCYSDETLLVAMERANIDAPSLCRVGSCGFCRSILLEGEVKMVGSNMKKAEIENNYIHPCVTYPDSDIVLRLDV